MDSIVVRDRVSGKCFEEQVYGGNALRFLYGPGFIRQICRDAACRLPWISALAGCWYKSFASRKSILPFIERYGIDASEFAEPVNAYSNFNDFFTRKLKLQSRPIATGENIAVMPADARYLFYPEVQKSDGFIVKGKKFSLPELVGKEDLEESFLNGSMLIARLCPSDYHRFHFPVDCKAGIPKLINGMLYSVNPWALAKDVSYLTQNKRFVTELDSPQFGKVLYVEIGATNVGSVVETYNPDNFQKKGDEKGYFEFGASCLVVLFQKGSIQFDKDLLKGPLHQEVRCLVGQSLGYF
ncbi:MAG: archaetidylserine decarboxylase [Parachlamydiales bacterium]|jgi:phosphatidylserine decarboxylase